MISTWCRDTVVIVHPAVQTVRGSDIPDWVNATRTTVNGCSMQPAGTNLSEDGRVLGVRDGYTCYMPENAPVLAGDRIEWNGKQYTITGDIRDWGSASGRYDHIILNLEAYNG